MSEPAHVDKRQIEALLDGSADLSSRVSSATALANCDDSVAARALLRVAQNPDAPVELLTAAGRALARICFRQGRDLDDVASADMTEEAFSSYDREIARLQHEQPHVRMQRGRIGSQP